MNRRIWLLVVVHAIAGVALSGWAALKHAVPFMFAYILLVPPFALTFCQSGLLAFWAAMSHEAIWKRTVGLGAGVIALEISLTLAINNDEYRYMPSTTTGLVAAALVIVRVWGAEKSSISGQPSNRQGIQYSIRGLLLLTLVVAVIVTVGKQVRLAGWTGPNLLTKCIWTSYFAVTNLVGIWAAMGRGVPWLKSAAAAALSVPTALAFDWCLGIEGDDWFYVTTIMVLETVLLPGALLVVRSCGYHLVPHPTSQRIRPQQDALDKGATGMASFVNLCLYELGWFACVLGAAGQRPWLGMALGLAFLCVHLALVREVQRHLALIVVAGAMGLAADSLLMSCGVLRYPNWRVDTGLAPPWDVVLWLQFATILPFCLRWLSRRYWLCAVAGFVGGPLAFYAGERLGAVTFLPPRLPHYAALAVVWSVALPALVWVSDRLIVIPGIGGRYRWLP